MTLIKLAIKELTSAPRFVTLFLINMAIGLAGTIILENFKITFNENLMTRSKKLLGADISIGGRHPFPQEIREKVKNFLQADQSISLMDMFSMVRTKKSSRLVFLSEYHPEFPFYGKLKLRLGKKILGQKEIWVYPELLFQLKIRIGEQIKIGKIHFTISDVIEEDSSQIFQLGSLAPKIFISAKGIRDAELIKEGSTVYSTTYYKTSKTINSKDEQQIIDIVNDNALRVTNPQKAAGQIGRTINYLTDFLGLVSLVALFMALIAIFYLYRSYLSAKRGTFAIMKSIGLTSKEILISSGYNLIFLSLLGTLGAIIISSIALPFLEEIIKTVIPLNLKLAPRKEALILGSLIGMLGALMVGIPLIMSSLEEKASNLFHEVDLKIGSFSKIKIIRFFPLFLFCLTLSIWASKSIRTGLIFTGILAILGTTLFLALNWLLAKNEKRVKLKTLEFTLALRYLTRYRMSTISIFLALFFGSLLINFIPALKNSIQKELDGGLQEKSPSLFLFDIQEEQVQNIKHFITEQNQVLLNLSPMIRARLTKLNDLPYEVENGKKLTRESQREQRFRNRGVNITYKMQTNNNDENIITGEKLSPFIKGAPPDVSLEFRYAERMGVEIGDKLTFEIMGIEQNAIVKNFRRVRWTSMRPNFFISFAPGVLNNAPKTFLAAISSMKPKDKMILQTKLVDKFPNVSAIDLDRLVIKLKEIINQMSTAMTVMSIIAIMVGMMVVFSLANHQINQRKKDLVLLKILGLNLYRLKKLILSEFFFLSFSASTLGSIFGLIVAFFFSSIVFEGLWATNPCIPLLTILLITTLCLMVSYMASRRTLKEKVTTFL